MAKQKYVSNHEIKNQWDQSRINRTKAKKGLKNNRSKQGLKNQRGLSKCVVRILM